MDRFAGDVRGADPVRAIHSGKPNRFYGPQPTNNGKQPQFIPNNSYMQIGRVYNCGCDLGEVGIAGVCLPITLQRQAKRHDRRLVAVMRPTMHPLTDTLISVHTPQKLSYVSFPSRHPLAQSLYLSSHT